MKVFGLLDVTLNQFEKESSIAKEYGPVKKEMFDQCVKEIAKGS